MKIQDKNSIINLLKTGDASERKEAIEGFMFNPIDEDILQILCGMLSDSNKGVRSTLSIALSMPFLKRCQSFPYFYPFSFLWRFCRIKLHFL